MPDSPEIRRSEAEALREALAADPATSIQWLVAHSNGAPPQPVASMDEAIAFAKTLPEGEVLIGAEATMVWMVTAVIVDEHGRDVAIFSDRSNYTLPASPPLDQGSALLQPITRDEHAAIENVLALLWTTAAEGGLNEAQERMLMSIAATIEQAHRETVPGQDERWKLVGVVRGGLRYLVKELPGDVIQWGAAGVILSSIDWHNLAQALPGG